MLRYNKKIIKYIRFNSTLNPKNELKFTLPRDKKISDCTLSELIKENKERLENGQKSPTIGEIGDYELKRELPDKTEKYRENIEKVLCFTFVTCLLLLGIYFHYCLNQLEKQLRESK